MGLISFGLGSPANIAWMLTFGIGDYDTGTVSPVSRRTFHARNRPVVFFAKVTRV